MELTESTLTILKNYAGINSNLVVHEGNSLSTVAEAKNIFAQCTVSEKFPRTFGIYDLNEFLGVLGLVDKPRLTFKEDYVIVNDSSGRSSVKYYFSDPDMLTHSSKSVVMPDDPEVSFELDTDTLSRIKRAAAALGHTEVAISGKAGESIIELTVLDSKNATSNIYTIDLAASYPDVNFTFYITIANLKMIPGNYQVNITSRGNKKIAQFVNTENNVTYYIAPEKSSTYGE